MKVGTRNAMVIAVANVALVVDWAGRTDPLRPRLGRARRDPGTRGRGVHLLRDRLAGARAARHRADLAEFTALVRAAARPIDDHRSTADYRRHAVGVCAARALERVLARRDATNLERHQWAS